MHSKTIQFTPYADPIDPTDEEIVVDLKLEEVALTMTGTVAVIAAYILGAREAHLSMTTNLDAAVDPEVPDAYEEGRADYMPAD